MAERRWRVRLGAAAEVDFANILKWTAENFGARQSRVYRDTLLRVNAPIAQRLDVLVRRVEIVAIGRPVVVAVFPN